MFDAPLLNQPCSQHSESAGIGARQPLLAPVYARAPAHGASASERKNAMRTAALLAILLGVTAMLFLGGCAARSGTPASVVRQPWMTTASPSYNPPPPGPQAP